MISIALIDDHPLAVKGLGAWLETGGAFRITGSAGNLAGARSLMENCEPLPDIVILDLSLGSEDGLDFIPALKEICAKRKVPLPGILLCSMHEDPFLIQRAIDAGIKGYVSKSADSMEIICAINAILAGDEYINEKYRIQSPGPWARLTPRENEIVSLLRRSMNNHQIARHLGLSIRTVENHLARVYMKMGVSSRRDLLEL